MKKAFTLAEVLITITAIGIISAIILPVALHSRPDENLLKFKKAHNTLYQIISSLISSNKYYKDGDLGLKPDGTEVCNYGSTATYFCQTIADLLSVKELDCYEYDDSDSRTGQGFWLASNDSSGHGDVGEKVRITITEETISGTKEKFDSACKSSGKTFGKEIETTDGVVYYQAGKTQFNTKQSSEPNALRLFSPPNEHPANYGDQDGFDIAYKIYCIDIDGIPADATAIDCKNECPFGYGIRADGKILPGKRAEEWLARDPQKED